MSALCTEAGAVRRAVTSKLFQALGLQQAGDADQARALYLEVLGLDPANAQALHLLGGLEYAQGRYPQAQALLARAAAQRPGDAAIQHLLGCALRALERWDEALHCLQRAVQMRPDLGDTHAELAVVLQSAGRTQDAIESWNRAIVLQPGCAGFHNNRAAALQEAQLFERARADYERALELEPANAKAHMNLGTLLQEEGRLDAAIEAFDRAIALAPGLAAAQYNKGCCLLLKGDYEQGWPLLETRWQVKAAPRVLPQPLWLGEESLAGRTILLHQEQGLGDTLMLCRFAPLLAALGARVVLEVAPAVLPLLQGLRGVAQVLPRGASLPAFDCHCPLFSLPLALRVRADRVPLREAAYLRADGARLRTWRERLGARRGLRVGIAWSGNPGHRNDRRRSIALARFIAHLPARCELVSLQNEVRETDLPTLQAHPALRHFGAGLRDFADTAALCMQMDLVLSVDTSVAHLAAALGRATWILLPFAPDYRWLQEGDRCPWYASARLFRQDAQRDWEPVLERVRAELEAV